MVKLIMVISLALLLLVGCGTTTQQQQATPAATPPAQSVQQQKAAPTVAAYVGNSSSKKVHKPSCKWAGKMKEEKEVSFSSRDEAIKEGYTPCKTCKP